MRNKIEEQQELGMSRKRGRWAGNEEVFSAMADDQHQDKNDHEHAKVRGKKREEIFKSSDQNKNDVQP